MHGGVPPTPQTAPRTGKKEWAATEKQLKTEICTGIKHYFWRSTKTFSDVQKIFACGNEKLIRQLTVSRRETFFGGIFGRFLARIFNGFGDGFYARFKANFATDVTADFTAVFTAHSTAQMSAKLFVPPM